MFFHPLRPCLRLVWQQAPQAHLAGVIVALEFAGANHGLAVVRGLVMPASERRLRLAPLLERVRFAGAGG